MGPDGEVAFWAEFSDDSQGIFVTSPIPVPEPGALASATTVIVGLALLQRHAARRRDRRSQPVQRSRV